MKLGYIGLGKMGYNMVQRLLEKGHQVVVFNKTSAKVKDIVKEGAEGADSIEGLVKKLESPRTIWVMVPHDVVDDVIEELVIHLDKGDRIIDGGNSHYKESMRRAESMRERGFEYIDVGVSGGPSGARNGASLMVGGKKEIYDGLEQLFSDLALKNGFGYMGNHGAGHFVKMVHNGIEYGMMQAIGEGFELMNKSDFNLDLDNVAQVYNNGSVVESSLTKWLSDAFIESGTELEGISGSVDQSGEGLWTTETAREMGVSIPIIDGSVKFRTESQKKPSYAGKVVSALRNQFGGHSVSEK
ncbi:phosphogluconate dehydrogenase (NAD(+)-dependent, decarboxylating) [Patescibacteria group bacterium]